MKLTISELLILFTIASSTAFAQAVLVVTPDPQGVLDMGQRVAQCNATLVASGAKGGVCDARNFTGTQFNGATSAPLTSLGVVGKPVQLLLGNVVLSTKYTIKLYSDSSIVGKPGSSGSSSIGTIIQETAGSNLSAVLLLTGSATNDGRQVLRDLEVNGDKNNNSLGAFGVEVYNSARVILEHVLVLFAPTHGIAIISDTTRNSSQGPRLINVRAQGCGLSGLYIKNTDDAFVTLSEFEQNLQDGIELDGAGGFRLEHSDVAGNGVNSGNGLYLYSNVSGDPGGYAIIVGNQFASNTHNDILILNTSAGNNVISSNAFLGIANGTAINMNETAGNDVIIGNMITYGQGTYLHCILTSGGTDQIVANTCP